MLALAHCKFPGTTRPSLRFAENTLRRFKTFTKATSMQCTQLRCDLCFTELGTWLQSSCGHTKNQQKEMKGCQEKSSLRLGMSNPIWCLLSSMSSKVSNLNSPCHATETWASWLPSSKFFLDRQVIFSILKSSSTPLLQS